MKRKQIFLKCMLLCLFTIGQGTSTASIISGTGTHFEISIEDSQTLTLDSSQDINVLLEYTPACEISILIGSTTLTSTHLTLGGLTANTTYYKYLNGVLSEHFLSQQDGKYVFLQDLSEPCHIFFSMDKLTLSYITPDGNVTPATVPIKRVTDETYVLIGDIEGSIVVQKDGITIDQNGYAIRGQSSFGYYIVFGRDITIENVNIQGYTYGVFAAYSYRISVIKSTITLNTNGLFFHSQGGALISQNLISSNTIGIHFWSPGHENTIEGNHICNNDIGIRIASDIYISRYNTVRGNTITQNTYGINISYCEEFEAIHNNFINNTTQVEIGPWCRGLRWDDGYPYGGNYWSDYVGIDNYSGSNQDQPRSDWIGDTPYIINASYKDNYPFMMKDGWRLDTTPPVSKLEVGNPKYEYEGKIYVSTITEFTITADDGEGRGVKLTKYRIDDQQPWILYKGNFTLAGISGISIIPGGCVGYWKFDEGEGATVIDSVGTNDGTICSATWTAGKIGNALSFDGVDDYVRVPNSDSFNLHKNSLTLEAWVYPKAYTGYWEGGIIGRVIDPYGWRLSVRSTRYSPGTICGGVQNLVWIDSVEKAPLNIWTHIVMVYDFDKDIEQLWVNGVKDNEVSSVRDKEIYANFNINSPLGIGLYYYQGNPNMGACFNGLIDEVAIYNRALTPEEIYSRYTVTIVPITEGHHTFSYYSTDVVDNKEVVKSTNIVVDVTSPDTPQMNLEPEFTSSLQNTVSWLESTDTLSGVYGYLVECSTIEDFTTIFSSSSWIKITSYTFANLSDGIKYFYRVKAKDNVGNETIWSNVVWSIQDNTAATFEVIPSTGGISVTAAGTINIDIIASEPLVAAPTVYVTQSGQEFATDITATLTTTDNISWTGTYDVTNNYDGIAIIEVTGKDRVGYTSKGRGGFEVAIGPTGQNIIISNVSDSPDPFSPRTGESTTIYYELSTSGGQISITTTTITFENAQGVIVDSVTIFNQTTGAQQTLWGGLDTNNFPFPDSKYTYRINVSGFKQQGPNQVPVSAIEKVGEITLLSYAELDTTGCTISNPSNAEITITPVSAVLPSAFGIQSGNVGSIYEIEPTNTTFSPAAILILRYTDDELAEKGIDENTLDIYKFIDGVWVAQGATLDTVNNTLTLAVTSLSYFVILTSEFVATPVAELDTTPPTFVTHLTIDPEVTDNLTITITASELLLLPPKVTVYPHGNSPQKESVKVNVSLVEGSETVYAGTFSSITGFGDIDRIVVVGRDLAGNEGVSDGTYTKNVISSAGGVISDARGKGVTVDIPEGAITGEIIVTIRAEDKSNSVLENKKKASAQKQELKLIGVGYKFGPDGTQFSKPVNISIPYSNEDIDGIDEKTLKMAYWNVSISKWELLKTSQSRTEENIVTAEVTHFSLYKIVAGVEKVLGPQPDATFKEGEIYAYPNPAKGSKNPTIHVECGIADGVEIRFYNLAAELVSAVELAGTDWKIRDNEYYYEYTWDVSNVASGVYVYLVQAKKDDKVIRTVKKVAVIK